MAACINRDPFSLLQVLKPDSILALNQVLGTREAEMLVLSLTKTNLGFQVLNIVMTGPKVFGMLAWVILSVVLMPVPIPVTGRPQWAGNVRN